MVAPAFAAGGGGRGPALPVLDAAEPVAVRVAVSFTASGSTTTAGVRRRRRRRKYMTTASRHTHDTTMATMTMMIVILLPSTDTGDGGTPVAGGDGGGGTCVDGGDGGGVSGGTLGGVPGGGGSWSGGCRGGGSEGGAGEGGGSGGGGDGLPHSEVVKRPSGVTTAQVSSMPSASLDVASLSYWKAYMPLASSRSRPATWRIVTNVVMSASTCSGWSTLGARIGVRCG